MFIFSSSLTITCSVISTFDFRMAGYRPQYTLDEDNLILEMIIKLEAFYILKSMNFWCDLQNLGYFDRTWQSMKEHFFKHMLPNIMDTKYTISLADKRRIKLSLEQSRQSFESHQTINLFDTDSD